MNIEIRLEEIEDQRKVEEMTRLAFYKEEKIEKIGIACDEHYLLHTLRKSDEFIKELNFLACLDGEIVGNIMYSKAYVLLENNTRHEVINIGPLSVLPKYQKLGIGGKLIRYSVKRAKELGYGSIIFFGHASYYPRFSFKRAIDFNITKSNAKSSPSHMAMELIDGDLKNVKGRFFESDLFDVDIKKAIEYDKNF